MMDNMKPNCKIAQEGADILVRSCGHVKSGEKILIIADESTIEVGRLLERAVLDITGDVSVMISKQEGMHGKEPSEQIALAMMNSDVVFGVTLFSMAHTDARFKACGKGARYLSLPDYNVEQLVRPALRVDFLNQAQIAKTIKRLLDKAKNVHVISEGGTDIKLEIDQRLANYCPGFCNRPGMMGSPPDIETNIAPHESESNGIIVVDGSIPCREIGLVDESIEIDVKSGSIVNISGGTQADTLEDVMDLSRYAKRGVLAEFGIGLNPEAELCGRMLEDEGCMGTVHFGFGSNAMIGGENKIDFHLDFVIKNPSITIDDFLVMDRGNLVL